MHLERVLAMESGYVLDFSNRTFADFFENEGDGSVLPVQLIAQATGSASDDSRRFLWFSAHSSRLSCGHTGTLAGMQASS